MGGAFTGTGKAEGSGDQRKERAVQVDRLGFGRPGVHDAVISWLCAAVLGTGASKVEDQAGVWRHLEEGLTA